MLLYDSSYVHEFHVFLNTSIQNCILVYQFMAILQDESCSCVRMQFHVDHTYYSCSMCAHKEWIYYTRFTVPDSKIFCSVCQDVKIYSFLNVNSPQKIKSKMKTFRSVFRIYLLHGRSNGLHDVYAIML